SPADDSLFLSTTAQLSALRAQRDAIAGDGDSSTTPPGTAGTMQSILQTATFSGTAVDHATALSLINGCRALMGLGPFTPTATPPETSTATTPTDTPTASNTPIPPTATNTPTPTNTGTASSSGVVISQVYGGGGNTGATLKNDFVELFNPGPSSVD